MLHLHSNGGFFRSSFLYTSVRHSYNRLCISNITPARAKLENFEPKISSCVQLAVLSG